MTWLWFLCAVAPPAFYALSNIFDQYVTRFYCPHSSFVFITIAGITSIPVSFFFFPYVYLHESFFDSRIILLSVLCGLSFSAALVPYFHALQKEDAHTVIPLLQTSVFFVAIGAWIFLKENLTLLQIMGGIVIVFSTVASARPSNIQKWPVRAVILILSASLLWSVYDLILREISKSTPSLVVGFWIFTTWGCTSIFLCLFKKNRDPTFAIIRNNPGIVLLLFFFQQIADMSGVTVSSIALSFESVPTAVTIVVSSGLHPVFIMILGAIGAVIFPRIYTFNLGRREIAYKILCFIVMMIGLWMVIMPSGG